MYVKLKHRHVHECGLVINPDFPFLGASPDGKICELCKTGNSGGEMSIIYQGPDSGGGC